MVYAYRSVYTAIRGVGHSRIHSVLACVTRFVLQARHVNGNTLCALYGQRGPRCPKPPLPAFVRHRSECIRRDAAVCAASAVMRRHAVIFCVRNATADSRGAAPPDATLLRHDSTPSCEWVTRT
ncbi:hypothetical protein EVAR_61402_1 [Eumeta japonica]|uniref:Uncharacterized protein n=1 Tax=Eumeta variegata TaxID=151549 RepID=A0A4C1YY09_EUMVA|nr:hypothetical protein EVAR_61402_1 [Eumeta japonica]